jgi:hypothetical protein
VKTYINGLQDIHTIILNERKVGGAVEAEFIRLRTGEEFISPVITSMDMDGAAIYSAGIFTNEGKRFIVSVNEISMISEPTHKRLHELMNKPYQEFKTAEKINYLLRLCELNEGSETPIFRGEVMQIADDIGKEACSKLNLRLSFLQPLRKLSPVRIA